MTKILKTGITRRSMLEMTAAARVGAGKASSLSF